jgi:predicted NBD/HSP70 family sugar kinase
MGIVIGGQLYRGARGSGGEFGHTKVRLEGALCRCGQRGCLEAYLADYALRREALGLGLVGPEMPLEDVVPHVLNLAADQNAMAESVVRQAQRMFALGLANLVNIFDPELIIIAGTQTRFDHLFAEVVHEEMRKSIVSIDRPPPDLVAHIGGNRMWTMGAAAHALQFVQDIAVEDLANAL